ncbi:MAG: hypothetical protein ACODAJ_05580 [Planctomycetota bacterium]
MSPKRHINRDHDGRPLIQGGQGKSGDDLAQDAWDLCVFLLALAAIAVLVLLGSCVHSLLT